MLFLRSLKKIKKKQFEPQTILKTFEKNNKTLKKVQKKKKRLINNTKKIRRSEIKKKLNKKILLTEKKKKELDKFEICKNKLKNCLISAKPQEAHQYSLDKMLNNRQLSAFF